MVYHSPNSVSTDTHTNSVHDKNILFEPVTNRTSDPADQRQGQDGRRKSAKWRRHQLAVAAAAAAVYPVSSRFAYILASRRRRALIHLQSEVAPCCSLLVDIGLHQRPRIEWRGFYRPRRVARKNIQLKSTAQTRDLEARAPNPNLSR